MLLGRKSFSDFELFSINIYVAVRLGIFHVRSRRFWGAAGYQHPLTPARFGAENGGLSQNRGARAVGGSPPCISAVQAEDPENCL